MFDPGYSTNLRVLRWNLKEMLRTISRTIKTYYVFAVYDKETSATSK